jgi:hypothetical protein
MNEVNQAKVRAAAVQVEHIAYLINRQAEDLRKKFDDMYEYLDHADPVGDVAFERYMLTLARAKSLCDVMPSLIFQAQAMQKFGLPARADCAAAAIHANTITLPVAVPA